jgi:hypothetical protein
MKDKAVIHRLIISIILFFIGITASVPSFAGWTISKKAEIRNKTGNIFKIERIDNGAVMAWLILKENTPGAFGTKLPVYQVDEHAVIELGDKRKVAKRGSGFVGIFLKVKNQTTLNYWSS